MPAPGTVAIIGRPNVGKSTLFNRLIGARKALVHDRPGVTRDRHYGYALVKGGSVRVVDTAGYEEGTAEVIAKRMNDISAAAVAEADAVLFVIDGRAGVTPLDEGLARLLKKSGKPVTVVINKVDTKASDQNLHEVYRLGFGDPLLVSAEHGIGTPDVLSALMPYAGDPTLVEDDEKAPNTHGEVEDFIPDEEIDEDEALKRRRERPLRLTIVGRPNAGKSTLINRLVGQERMMTGPEAGLTRESLSTEWVFEGQKFELVDTAGLRRKARITDRVEQLGASSAIRAIENADVVVLLLDATMPFEHQDQTIAARVIDEGKPLIIALNKWDRVKDKEKLLDEMRYQLDTGLSQVKNIPMVAISALTGMGMHRLLKPVLDVYDLWHKRIPTGQLNRFLQGAVEAHHPPMSSTGKAVKLKYMAQTGIRPPTFTVVCNLPKAVTGAYLRYLTNGLREAFALHGIVLRVRTRGGSSNPYVRTK
jgi:GTP-binding protein